MVFRVKLLVASLLFVSFFACADESAAQGLDGSDLFNEQVIQEVHTQRVIEQIQQDFEESLSWRLYAVPTTISCATFAAVCAASAYGVCKFFNIDENRCKDYPSLKDLSFQERLALHLSPVPSVVLFNFMLSRLNSSVTERQAIAVGKKYNLTAEQCLSVLLGCDEFLKLFVQGDYIGVNGMQSRMSPAYYKDGQTFIDRYNRSA